MRRPLMPEAAQHDGRERARRTPPRAAPHFDRNKHAPTQPLPPTRAIYFWNRLNAPVPFATPAGQAFRAGWVTRAFTSATPRPGVIAQTQSMPDAMAEINMAPALVDFGNRLFVGRCGVRATLRRVAQCQASAAAAKKKGKVATAAGRPQAGEVPPRHRLQHAENAGNRERLLAPLPRSYRQRSEKLLSVVCAERRRWPLTGAWSAGGPNSREKKSPPPG